ncbi:MAG: methionyl-tRNA formyltransferase, partial [Pseudomonadota bacterium]
QPARPAGRGKKLRPTPVAEAAATLGLEARTPLSFKDPAARAAFAALEADAAVVVAYGLLLPQAVLDAPRLGCFNLHASLLPRWRGAAPIQRAVMEGDALTGACVMRMTLGLDEGPVLSRFETPIGPSETSGDLFARLATEGAALMVETLGALACGAATETPQAETGVTYAKKIDKAEARLDWAAPAEDLDRRIRGLAPSPGAWCETAAGERLKILLAAPEAVPAGAEAAAPGEALDDALLIACGTGAVRLRRVQRAGKGVVEAATLPSGALLTKGERLR